MPSLDRRCVYVAPINESLLMEKNNYTWLAMKKIYQFLVEQTKFFIYLILEMNRT